MTLLKELRCPYCSKLLCKYDGTVQIKCSRCKRIIEM
ncbi:Com family DNA-binding transcriptional regulator [Vibrio parahaemolyticus]